MKRILNIMLFFLSIFHATSQNILLQSSDLSLNEKILKEYTNLFITNKDSIDAILNTNQYQKIPDEAWDALENFKKFLENPFQENLKAINLDYNLMIIKNIDSVLKEIYSPSKMVKERTNVNKTRFNKPITFNNNLPFSNGLNFTTRLIDATSSLIINKLKTELSISFYEKMNVKMKDSFNFVLKADTLKIGLNQLLNHTFTLIETQQAFVVPDFGTTWITAFQKDLSQLPFTMMEEFKNEPAMMQDELGRYAMVLNEGINQLYKGYSISNSLETLSSEYDAINLHQIDYQISLLKLILKNSDGIDQEYDENYNINQYSKLNENGKKYFTGLFYQSGLQMGFNNCNQFKINENNYNQYFELIKDVQIELRKLESAASKMENPMTGKVAEAADFVIYSQLFLDVINSLYENNFYIENHNNNIYNTLINKDANNRKRIEIGKNILSFYEDKNTNNYGNSLLSTISFLNHLSSDSENYKLIRDITFYGSFFADMIMASTNENINIENILNKYAMPVTSYRVKRHYRSSIDISAYPGLNLGYEFSKSNSPSFGITAPIGFSFSWRSDSKEIYAPSHSLFISAIDLGAPVSYRLMNDAANGLPENIKWKQIFSPGLYYIYGFKNAPMCLSVGVQYTPLLRKIETDSILEEENVVKAGVSLMVDIPLFSIYKNTKNSDH
jgi:hypothetical protein